MMTIPEGLRPETIWKLLEHEGFQILVQNGYDTEQDERPCFRISSPMNGVMVSLAMRGGDDAWCQKVFDATNDGARCLEALIKQVEPMMDVLLNPPLNR
jgi:hypothetical protein